MGRSRSTIFEEALVIERRLVVRERVIVRKHTVTEDRLVEADLRRERVEFDADPEVAARAAPGLGVDNSHETKERKRS